MTDKQLPAIIERGAIIAADFMPVLEVQQAVERRNAIVGFVQQIMIEGTDYGKVPGVDKPTLLQPGAEKLIAFFGLTPRMELVDKIEDWKGKEHGEPLFFYRYRCTISRGERVLGVEEASANSWEVKYRYRWVPDDQVPAHLDKATLPKRDSSISEFAFAVEKRETAGQYGKPAEYWNRFEEAIKNKTAVVVQKKTKAGKDMQGWMIPAIVYRVPNQENADTINTIMQMSEKRAKIRAVRSCTGASEFFTQDVEDMQIIDVVPVKEAEKLRDTPTAHRPSDGAMESLPEDQQAAMNKFAVEVMGFMKSGRIKDAVEWIASANLVAEEEVAFWALLPSGERTAIKKKQAELKGASK